MVARVVGLGAGGHARVVLEILRQQGMYELVGLLDSNPELHGSRVGGVPVLGDDDLLECLIRDGVDGFFVGVGSAIDTTPRRRLFEWAADRGLTPVSAVHSQSTISASATLGKGVTLMAGAIVNAEAVLGDNAIINTGAIIEHDCVIGDHVHVATGARLAGAVIVGEGAHIGLGASVCQGVVIGKNALVGAGAVVTERVADNVVVIGVPGKPVRKRDSPSAF